MSHTPVLLFLGFRTAWQKVREGVGGVQASSGTNISVLRMIHVDFRVTCLGIIYLCCDKNLFHNDF